jgi:replicative DNA helicase
MLELREEDKSIDSGMLINLLRERGELEGVGGSVFILNLSHGVPAMLPKAHISEVLRLARKRSIMQFAERFAGRASDTDETEDELLNFASDWIDRARTKLPNRPKIVALSEMVDDQANRYRLWFKGISNALPTGFELIDKHLLGGGLVASGLYVLAGRPSMGKSSLALDIAANVAALNKNVYMVSQEMPAEALLDRLHAAGTGIARWKLRPGIYKSEYERLLQTLPTICQMPITFDNSSISVSELRGNVREQERKHRRPDFIIVDYMQQLRGKGRSRTEEVGSVSRDLKGLAMEMQIPILGLSQMSRDQAKQNREPELTDLRDSGELEQDADAVFFLYGDKPEEGAKIYSRMLKCAKQREGALFHSEMVFNGELVTFRSIEQLMASGVHDHTEATQ